MRLKVKSFWEGIMPSFNWVHDPARPYVCINAVALQFWSGRRHFSSLARFFELVAVAISSLWEAHPAFIAFEHSHFEVVPYMIFHVAQLGAGLLADPAVEQGIDSARALLNIARLVVESRDLRVFLALLFYLPRLWDNGNSFTLTLYHLSATARRGLQKRIEIVAGAVLTAVAYIFHIYEFSDWELRPRRVLVHIFLKNFLYCGRFVIA